MTPGILGGDGAHIRLASGRRAIDFDMDGGRVVAGHAHPDVAAAVAAAVLTGRPRSPGPVPAPAATGLRGLLVGDLAAARHMAGRLALAGSRVADMATTWWRTDPPADADFVVVGDLITAGLPGGAVLWTGEAPPADLLAAAPPPHPIAAAAAEALARAVGEMPVVQLTGRAAGLAAGLREVAPGLEATTDGGTVEIRCPTPEIRKGFAREMLARGVLVPESGPWYPSLAHDFYDVEVTIDHAAAAWAATLD